MTTPPHLSEEELIRIVLDRINRNSTYGVDPNNHPLHNKQSVDDYYKTKAQRNAISGNGSIVGSIYHDSSCNTESINPGECIQQQVIICNSDTDKWKSEHVLTPEELHAIHHCDYISNNDISFMYPHKIGCIDVGTIFPSVKSVFDKWYAALKADKRLTFEQIVTRDEYRKRVSNRCNNKKTYRYKRRK